MPASHAGDHRSEAGQGRQFPARGSRGIADPPDSESGSLGRASRLAPTNFTAPKSILSDALLWYGSRLGASPGGGSNIVAVAVRQHRSRASAQVGFIRPLRRGQHWGLRPSFALRALAWQAIYASLQQPVDFFCKEIVPGQHRREAPI